MKKVIFYSVLTAVVAFSLVSLSLAQANISLSELIAQIAGKTLGEKLAEQVEVGEVTTLGAFPGPDIYSDVNVFGRFTNSPTVRSTTTSGTAATLVAADLVNGGYHAVTLGGAVNLAFTYTLPASSTIPDLVRDIGSVAESCWVLTGTSTDAQLIFAAGTGIDLRFASSSATAAAVPSLQAGNGQEICFKFRRQVQDGVDSSFTPGDITARVEIMSEAD